MPNLIEIIKKASLEVVENTNPVNLLFGLVTSVSPLEINIDQRLTLGEDFLISTSLVSNFQVNLTLNHSTEYKSGGSGDDSFASHNHDIVGNKTATVNLGLQVGEKVILLRVQGGQKYVILDRVR